MFDFSKEEEAEILKKKGLAGLPPPPVEHKMPEPPPPAPSIAPPRPTPPATPMPPLERFDYPGGERKTGGNTFSHTQKDEIGGAGREEKGEGRGEIRDEITELDAILGGRKKGAVEFWGRALNDGRISLPQTKIPPQKSHHPSPRQTHSTRQKR